MEINLGKLNDFEKNPIELVVNANKLLINKSKCIAFFKKIGGHKSFCGVTDTPLMSPLGFKARLGSVIYTWQRYM